MPTKKSTPAKKDAPKKSVKDQSGFKWKQTGEFKIPGTQDIARTYDVSLPERQSESLLAAFAKQNEELRVKLAIYEAPKDQKAANKPEPMSTMLTQFCEQMDGQLSRLYNSINTLEATTDRLQFAKKDGSIAEGTMPQDADLNTRLGRLLDHLSYQNSRFEDLNAKLNNLI